MARPNDVDTHTLDPRAGIIVAGFYWVLSMRQAANVHYPVWSPQQPLSDCHSSAEQAKELRLTGAVWLELRTSWLLSLSMCCAVLGYVRVFIVPSFFSCRPSLVSTSPPCGVLSAYFAFSVPLTLCQVTAGTSSRLLLSFIAISSSEYRNI